MIALLEQGQAHLWRLPLAAFAEGRLLEAGLPLLSVEEQDRYAAGKHPRFRALLLAGRLLIRCVLSEYHPVRPEDWVIDIGGQGKPLVRNAPPGLVWNLSHTEGMAVLLVAKAEAVGVDIEKPSRVVDPLVTGRPVFSPLELAGLRGIVDEVERRHQFYRIWTVKESLVKAIGAGITDDLRHVTFDVSKPVPRLVETVPVLAAPPNSLFFSEVFPQGYFVAGTIFPLRTISGILYHDATAAVSAAIGR